MCLLIVVPVGVLAAGSVEVDFALALPLFGFLSFGTVLLFTFVRTDFNLSVAESYALISAYLIFILWMILESLQILSLLPPV